MQTKATNSSLYLLDILARVRSGKLALESLEALVINGQLPAEDVDLLVKEGAVREDDAEKLLEDSAEEVNEAYSQATAFSMLVNDNKVSFEELQMMRVKGVLGNSVIHFLVNEVRMYVRARTIRGLPPCGMKVREKTVPGLIHR